MQWVATHLMARIDKSAAGIKEPLAAMQAMFQAHVAFVADHPGAPRMLFGELQGATLTPAKRLAQALMAQYAARLNDLILAAKSRGELPPELDVEAATVLFIGTIQGLVMQALISGDMGRMLTVAPRVFHIYRRGIETTTPDPLKG
jgi:TetR/AcrR family transcriptional regulator